MADDRLSKFRQVAGAVRAVRYPRWQEPRLGSVVHLWSRHAEIDPASEIIVEIVRWAADATFAGKVGMFWLWSIALWADLIGLQPGARPEARLLPVENPPPT